jgi:hypothetical protein
MNTTKQIIKMNQRPSEATIGMNLMPSLYLYNRTASNHTISCGQEIWNTIDKVSLFIPHTANNSIQVLWNIQGAEIKMKKVFCSVGGSTNTSIHMDQCVRRTTNLSIQMDLASISSQNPKSIWINKFVEPQTYQSTWIEHNTFNIYPNPSGSMRSSNHKPINPHGFTQSLTKISFS